MRLSLSLSLTVWLSHSLFSAQSRAFVSLTKLLADSKPSNRVFQLFHRFSLSLLLVLGVEVASLMER